MLRTRGAHCPPPARAPTPTGRYSHTNPCSQQLLETSQATLQLRPYLGQFKTLSRQKAFSGAQVPVSSSKAKLFWPLKTFPLPSTATSADLDHSKFSEYNARLVLPPWALRNYPPFQHTCSISTHCPRPDSNDICSTTPARIPRARNGCCSRPPAHAHVLTL